MFTSIARGLGTSSSFKDNGHFKKMLDKLAANTIHELLLIFTLIMVLGLQ